MEKKKSYFPFKIYFIFVEFRIFSNLELKTPSYVLMDEQNTHIL